MCVAALVAAAGGCAAEVDGNVPPRMEDPSYYDEVEPVDEPEMQAPEPDPMDDLTPWYCGYHPSYDDNWHNDVTCTNGVQTDVPNLLPNDSYITPAEMEAAAKIYEDQLNGY